MLLIFFGLILSYLAEAVDEEMNTMLLFFHEKLVLLMRQQVIPSVENNLYFPKFIAKGHDL